MAHSGGHVWVCIHSYTRITDICMSTFYESNWYNMIYSESYLDTQDITGLPLHVHLVSVSFMTWGHPFEPPFRMLAKWSYQGISFLAASAPWNMWSTTSHQLYIQYISWLKTRSKWWLNPSSRKNIILPLCWFLKLLSWRWTMQDMSGPQRCRFTQGASHSPKSGGLLNRNQPLCRKRRREGLTNKYVETMGI